MRSGVSAGLPMCGEGGAEAKMELALRKGNRLEDEVAEPSGEWLSMAEDGGCSSSGVVEKEVRTGEGDRRTGKAERKLFDGRLLGDGACAGRRFPIGSHVRCWRKRRKQ